MHLMIVEMVFMHKFLFEGRDHAAKGEVVHVAVFCLLRLGPDAAEKRLGTAHRGEKALPDNAMS